MKLLSRFFEKPAKREQRRRLTVHERGRLGEAYILDTDEASLFYSYSVRGVQYQACQDISALLDHLPAAPERLLGQARVKYLLDNPANSILLCEDWSGLRAPQNVE
jgi:hypothetical protein